MFVFIIVLVGYKAYPLVGVYNNTRSSNSENEVKKQVNASLDEWIPKANMNEGRYGHTTVTLDGKICAIGGWGGNELSTVEEYNPETNKWTQKASMNEARTDFTIEILNGKIYIIGGGEIIHEAPEKIKPLSTVEEYTP